MGTIAIAAAPSCSRRQPPSDTLRVGALGPSSTATTNPYSTFAGDFDMTLMSLVFDPLTVPGGDTQVAPRLAASWRGDDNLASWTFQLAEHATFHDGSPVTSEDVAESLRVLRRTPGQAWKIPVPEAGIRATGPHEVTLTLDQPNSQLPMLLRLMTFTTKNGTSRTLGGSPGSGPFKVDSVGSRALDHVRLTRHDGWPGNSALAAPQAGGTRVAALELTRFASVQALADAVVAGQIDLAMNVGPLAARAMAGRPDLQVIRRPGDLVVPLAVRCSDGPFANPKAREAIRLAVDREALVSQVLSGYGSVANDVLGTADPAYDRALPQRTRDLDRARSLFAEAGVDLRRTYQLFTKDEAFGEVNTAKLIAGQLAEAGLKIEVVQQEPEVFAAESWHKAALTTVSWGTNDSVLFFADKVLDSKSQINETAFRDPDFDAAHATAVSGASAEDRDRATRELQRIQHERGGYVVWGTADGVDVASARVHDAPKLGGWGRTQLERVWLR
ncbi:ABC transporter substrate-binding protein [Segniliparus rugosus]|uniref:ABC transporter substrate-binding protein n=1 Tax=Segniliparus rugosus TaxID=286804 RepID=UPI0002E04982|nr:ABC transporter substrate-binding protein [Segniliparus rugosus]